MLLFVFFFNDTATTEIYTLSLHDALPISLRPASMRLDRDRPEILQPPEHPQACCEQQTITVPPDVLAKTAQKHDYPSAAWRRPYARRTGAERGFPPPKDPPTNHNPRGRAPLH